MGCEILIANRPVEQVVVRTSASLYDDKSEERGYKANRIPSNTH